MRKASKGCDLARVGSVYIKHECFEAYAHLSVL